MDTIVDDLSTRLAHRLRLERDSRGWSLADLADRSGVSKATISKIERAEVSPTAVVLVRLAGAFDLTLAGLMLRAEGQGERHSRAAEQPVWRDPGVDDAAHLDRATHRSAAHSRWVERVAGRNRRPRRLGQLHAPPRTGGGGRLLVRLAGGGRTRRANRARRIRWRQPDRNRNA